ncbi:MAG: OmpH family outer membrane protein [Alphaproteobacteria bacterium]|nr:OmpH family outer membrane protein [Alphaproteobacteria bacterium]
MRALACLLLLITTAAEADDRIAHIDTAALFSTLPARAQAEAKLAQHRDALARDHQAIVDELERKNAEYEQNKGKMADHQRMQAMRDIEDLEARAKAFASAAERDLANQSDALLEPLLKNVRETIQAVAREKGYTYVLDSSNGTVLMSPEADDLLPLVRARLGVQ